MKTQLKIPVTKANRDRSPSRPLTRKKKRWSQNSQSKRIPATMTAAIQGAQLMTKTATKTRTRLKRRALTEALALTTATAVAMATAAKPTLATQS